MPVLTKINTNVIADDAVTSAKIPADAVIASDIAAGAVGSSEIAANITLTGDYVGIPSATTTERDALTPVVGMLIYNSTLGIMQQYAASGWASIDSPPTVSSLNYPGDDTALDTVGEYNDATCDYNNDPTITHDTNSNMKAGMSVSGTGIPVGATITSVTSTTAFELSASTTGGAVTNGTLTFNTQTLVITGTNFQTGATVTIDGTATSTVTRDSSTQITVTGTPAKTAGTKVDGLVVSNTSGLSASINVDYSPLPGWTSPASGNLLNDYTGTITEIALTGGADTTSYAITTGALPAGLTIGSTDGDINGNMTASAATYNFTVDAIDAQAQSSPRLFNIISKGVAPATGGTITDIAGYRVHTFLLAQSGTNFVNAVALTIDYLVVAGGGAGGGSGPDWVVGGGGGAGGYFNATSYSLAAGTHAITVGAGGNGASGYSTPSNAGGNSVFGSIQTANGGGRGASYAVSVGTGGSGGGGASNSTTGGASTGGGNSGGNGMDYTTNASIGAGGGGGSSAVGSNGSSSVGGAGGNGTTITISGASVEYAAGGGGAHGTNGTGNEGGSSTAGDGVTGQNDGGDATDNFGDGGGGATSGDGANRTGGDGGNGVVIIRYAA